MWDTIRRLVATGSTVLLTTQYLDEADQLADRIAVIDRGRVVAEGTADELKASSATASLQLRLVDPRRHRGRARRASARALGVRGRVSSAEAGWLTVPLQDPDGSPTCSSTCATPASRLAEFSVQKPSLDEVFLTITGSSAEPIHADEEPEKDEVLA